MPPDRKAKIENLKVCNFSPATRKRFFNYDSTFHICGQFFKKVFLFWINVGLFSYRWCDLLIAKLTPLPVYSKPLMWEVISIMGIGDSVSHPVWRDIIPMWEYGHFGTFRYSTNEWLPGGKRWSSIETSAGIYKKTYVRVAYLVFIWTWKLSEMLQGWQGWWTSAKFLSGTNAFTWSTTNKIIDANDR